MSEINIASVQSKKQGDCLSPFIYITSLAWLIITSLVRFTSTIIASGMPGPESNRIEWTSALLHALSLIIPLIVLSRWWSNPRYRTIYHAWLWAAGSMLLTSPIFLIEIDEAQTSAAVQIGALLVYIFLLLIQRRYIRQKTDLVIGNSDSEKRKSPSWTWYLSGLIGLMSLAPWVLNGALGSVLDSLLYFVIAILLSIAALLVIETFIWTPFQPGGKNSIADLSLVATGIGGVLHLLVSATAFPFGGMHFLLWLSVPILGWSVASIWMLSHRPFTTHASEPDHPLTSAAARFIVSGPAVLLLTLALAGPMIFIDGDELAMVISASLDEILFVALRSAAISLLIGLLAGISLAVLSIWQGRQKGEKPSRKNAFLKIALAAVTILLVGFLFTGYWVSGQPGFYGERMLVILQDQKDVSSALEIQDYQTRREFVYQTLADHAQDTQADLLNLLDRFNFPYTPYYLLNAIETVDNPILRIYLLTRSDVDRILDSPRLRPLPEAPSESLMSGSNPAPLEIPWNVSLVRADQVWQEFGVTGKGIVIGQSDSGVQGDHPDLAAQYRGRDGDHDYDWFDPWYASPSPVDSGGHGTHTLGTALGKRTGIAPDAEWIACVNLARNLGNPALYLDCMQFMLAPFPQGGDPFTQGEPGSGAHVLNNSWGCPQFEGCDALVFLPSVRALEAAGIFVVSGAGNEGPACSTINSPLAVYDEVFAVGAIDEFGELAIFSSLGPVLVDGSQRIKPDLLAPGVDVLSTLPNSSYGAFSGTSMASPHVTGVVALLWSANPNLIGDIETTWQILTQSAQPFSGSLPACQGAQNTPSTASGYGILDAFAAVQMALNR